MLDRFNLTDKRTIGRLRIGAFYCFTLEDTVRTGPKVPGATAIPVGTYTIDLTVSSRVRYGTLWTPWDNDSLPELRDVPGFSSIRIHAGNNAENTEGCILVGKDWQGDTAIQSRLALTALKALLLFPCEITINNPKE